MSNFRCSDRAEGAKKKEKTFVSLPKKKAFFWEEEFGNGKPQTLLFGFLEFES